MLEEKRWDITNINTHTVLKLIHGIQSLMADRDAAAES